MARSKTQDPSTTTELNPSSDATEAQPQASTEPGTITRTPYELQGNDVPEVLRGKSVTMPIASDLAGAAKLVHDGKEDNIVSLFQNALNVNRQRVFRTAAASEEVADVLAGKGDAEALAQDEREARALELIQAAGDNYLYGAGRSAGTGTTTKAKKFDEAKAKAAQAAAADPALAAKLREIFGADFSV